MSYRAERREAERLNRKLAYQQSRQNPTAAAPVATPAQSQADRANAQFSTGPISAEGEAASARNAIKHGLTGNTVLLDSDDAAEYQARLDCYASLYQSATFEERRLVQAVHDANWRLDRITNLESTIYAKGRQELEGSFEELPAAQRKSFIQGETSQRYAKPCAISTFRKAASSASGAKISRPSSNSKPNAEQPPNQRTRKLLKKNEPKNPVRPPLHPSQLASFLKHLKSPSRTPP